MKKLSPVLVVILMASAVCAQTSQRPPVFSATSDFSLSSNPNGAWSYGWSQSKGSLFVPFTLTGQTCCSAEEGWLGPLAPDPGYPLVLHNIDPPTAALDMAGGPNDEFAVVRWTAPAPGFYRIAGVFYGLGSTVSDVYVLRGRTSLFKANIAGTSTANFNLSAFFASGSTIDFAVHVTPENFANGAANTGMQVAISQGPMYAYRTYDAPTSSNTQIRGINNNGKMVGIYTDTTSGLIHGFLLTGNQMTVLDFPGASQTYPRSINNRGQIVGFFLDNAEVYHGFTLSNGSFQQVDYPGALATLLRGINDLGQIVGDYIDATNTYIHAFSLNKGKFTVFDYPGAPGTQGYGINNLGLIVGSYDSTDWTVLHGYLKFGQTFVSYDAPGSIQTEFMSLNDLGQPVGYYVDGVFGYNVPFLLNYGQLKIVTPPGAYAGIARGVNNLGVIIGTYTSSAQHSFIATPMP